MASKNSAAGDDSVKKKLDMFGYSKFDQLDISDDSDDEKYPEEEMEEDEGEFCPCCYRRRYGRDEFEDEYYDSDEYYSEEYTPPNSEDECDDEDDYEEEQVMNTEGGCRKGSGKAGVREYMDSAAPAIGRKADVAAKKKSAFNFTNALAGVKGSESERGTSQPEKKSPSGGQKQLPVRIHPSDSRRGLNPVFYEENPWTYKPKPNPSTGVIEVWGTLNGYDDPASEIGGMMMRQMETQSLYSFNSDPFWKNLGTPEKQWVKAMKQRKIESLQQSLPQCMRDFTRDVVLRISLVRYPYSDEQPRYHELSPSVWRRVVVSGGMVLRSFHDRVIGPAMGWTRGYHGYCFTDIKDGAVFGPESSEAIDMMHLGVHFIDCMHDTDVSLVQLLRQKGDRIMYTYDLGDQWIHMIELEEMRTVEDSYGKCRILDGAMACPPEDSCGLKNMGCFSYQEEILDHKGPLPRSVVESIVSATNVGGSHFDPTAFNLSFANQRVLDAISGKASVAGGEMRYTHSLYGGFDTDAGPSTRRGTRTENIPAGPSTVLQRTVRTTGKDPKRERVCACCGSPHNLKACARCRAVYYCSRECQNKAWPTHKRDCVRKEKSIDSKKLKEKRIHVPF